MSNSHNWFEHTPKWIWLSFIPGVGGLSICYAGWVTKTKSWIGIGVVFTLVALTLPNSLSLFIWLGQIATAFSLKQKYLIKKAPKGVQISNVETAKLMAKARGTVDINNCSVDDLVYQLNLPIVYANDIDLVRKEGYIFTDIDELSEIVGIPESTLRRIKPLVVFSYDIRKEEGFSWHKLNNLSIDELIAWDLDPVYAKKIVEEREHRGNYQSVLDIRKRTGIPIKNYTHLI